MFGTRSGSQQAFSECESAKHQSCPRILGCLGSGAGELKMCALCPGHSTCRGWWDSGGLPQCLLDTQPRELWNP